jgi:hypothetical protein
LPAADKRNRSYWPGPMATPALATDQYDLAIQALGVAIRLDPAEAAPLAIRCTAGANEGQLARKPGVAGKRDASLPPP